MDGIGAAESRELLTAPSTAARLRSTDVGSCDGHWLMLLLLSQSVDDEP